MQLRALGLGCATLLCCASPAIAAEPFTGTWKLDLASAKFSQTPDKNELANGTWKCFTCDPPVIVKADGRDQPVSGHSNYDTLSIRIVDDRTVEEIEKKAGKTIAQVKTTVSPDGATARMEFTSYPAASAKPVTGAATMKRVGKAPAGMHAFSGSWVAEKAENVTDNGLLVAFEQTADGLKMTQPTGEHYDAKLDGKPYAYGGSPGTDTVVLKRIGTHVIEETDKRGDKVLSTVKMTISSDGKSLTMVVNDPVHGVSSFVFKKQ